MFYESKGHKMTVNLETMSVVEMEELAKAIKKALPSYLLYQAVKMQQKKMKKRGGRKTHKKRGGRKSRRGGTRRRR